MVLGFDIGGSSVKYAVVDASGNFLEKGKETTPKTKEEFFALIKEIQSKFAEKYTLSGAAFSFPGAVDDVVRRHRWIERASLIFMIFRCARH
jgi:predicted NBD/HSP70 family sugar kinase